MTRSKREISSGPVANGIEASSMVYPMGKTVLEDRFAAITTSANHEDTNCASVRLNPRLRPGNTDPSLTDATEPNKSQDDMPNPSSAASSGNVIRRAGKVALGLAVLEALGWVPLRAIFATTSVEALVNARVETFRSPIEGIVVGNSGRRTILEVRDADECAHRRSPRGSNATGRLAPGTPDARIGGERAGGPVRSGESRTHDARCQIEKFRNGRLKLLDARLSSQAYAYEAAVAKASQAAADKRRTDELIKSGWTTAAESDRRLYEWLAARATEAADKKRLAETKVERDAIANGVFVGDSYNDKPESEQQATELRLKAAKSTRRPSPAGPRSSSSPNRLPKRKPSSKSARRRLSISRRTDGSGKC